MQVSALYRSQRTSITGFQRSTNMTSIFDRLRVRHQKGYILLLTVLVVSILLAISFGIYALTLKGIILASFLRDSQKAFSAADRAVECALYWDRSYPQNVMSHTVFATGTIGTQYDYPGAVGSAQCDGVVLNSAWTVVTQSGSATTTYPLTYTDGTCADVEVGKTGNEGTTVTGNGYNNCTVGDPRRTQRTIQVLSNL